MKTKSNTRENVAVLPQICNLIPANLVSKAVNRVREQHGIKVCTRTFSVWSQVVSLMFCHLAHCLSLNDICDALGFHCGLLNRARNATAPCRNTLSHANRTRSSEIIKAIYWDVLKHYQQSCTPFFQKGARCYFRMPRRFKRVVRAIDSTTIELIHKCMDWAKHRKRKAAAKLHMSLDVGSFLPIRIISEPARDHDSNYMVELCADMKSGDIAVFDKAYVAYEHLNVLSERGVFWVTRAKENARFKVIRERKSGKPKSIISDVEVELSGKVSHNRYPQMLRLIRAQVKDSKGEEKTITFLTNNFEWAASSVCDLYRARWSIETFFKEIKQTLQLRTFVGFSRNAIEWQLWSAMLVYLLLRILAWQGKWQSDFRHFFTFIKGVLWCRRDVLRLISDYGTAGGRRYVDLCPSIPFLKGIDWSQIE